MIYLDNAATTFPKPSTVYKETFEALTEYGANPGRSGHALSMKAGNKIFDAREKIASFFGASAEEVCFTKNATEALNIAIKGSHKDGEIIISDLEHNSVYRPALKSSKNGLTLKILKTHGTDDEILKRFSELITRKTKTVCITHASNVTGQILPVYEIGKICKKHGLRYIVDASQSAGILPLNVKDCHIDFLCAAGHKSLYGPMGTGILIAIADAEPLTEGGTGVLSSEKQMPDFTPERFESGTLNLPGIVGLGAGIDFIKSETLEKTAHFERELMSECLKRLSKEKGITVYSAPPLKNVNIFSFAVSGGSSGEVSEMLNVFGIYVRSGLHCSPLAHRKLKTDKEGLVRASFGAFNTENDVLELCRAVSEINRYFQNKI